MTPDETPLQKLNEELKEAHVDPSLVVDHEFSKQVALDVVIDPIKESESVEIKVKI